MAIKSSADDSAAFFVKDFIYFASFNGRRRGGRTKNGATVINLQIVGAAFARTCIPQPFSGASRDLPIRIIRGWKAAPTICKFIPESCMKIVLEKLKPGIDLLCQEIFKVQKLFEARYHRDRVIPLGPVALDRMVF